MKPNIVSIINFCTNDVRYLEKNVQECAKFSKEILIPVCDHFFDGTCENRDLLHDLYLRHRGVRFIEYAYSDSKLYNPFLSLTPSSIDWKMYWYTTSRYIGYLYAKGDYLLFLDTDEIVEGDRFVEWMKGFDYENYEAIRFLSFYYFRNPLYRATVHPPNAMLAKRSSLSCTLLMNDWDRYGAFSRIQGKKEGKGLGADGKPLVHHYSWVRSKEECIKKGETSGHSREYDFPKEIEQEFSHPFQGSDFLFSYTYEKAPCFFDPLSYEAPQKLLQGDTSHILRIHHREAFLDNLWIELKRK